jgi:hypothetical protein
MRARKASASHVLLAVVLGAACVSGACSTGTTSSGTPSSATPTADSKPSLRLFLLSNVAGALEPCGCSKDQLGGASHFASLFQAEKAEAKSALVLGAGPLFFQDPKSMPEKATQDRWKAEALAKGAEKLGVAAWTPGVNDFAAGVDGFRSLAGTAQAGFLAANARGAAGLSASKTIEVDGIRIGVTGVVDPKVGAAGGFEVEPPVEALRREVAALRSGGARLVVVLAALPRGEALRLTDAIPDLDVLVVGKPSEKGDGNDAPRAPVLAGSTLVVELSNHLQTTARLDLFLREDAGGSGRIQLADGSGLARAEQLVGVSQQIRDLEHRINGWESSKVVRADDLAARKKDLERLRTEKLTLESQTAETPTGSYFKYSLVEIREKLGKDPAMEEVTLGYYKRVNDHNKVAFKDRMPPAAGDGPSYLGVDACSTCHAEERAVWDKTGHAKAYETLEKKFVEFNLDCVSCHVTGYEKPGGSTVTFVDSFKGVQCETCHGPGSLHAKEPTKKGLVQVKPEPKSCVSECHHPPHVEGFDPVAKMPSVLGPGHGL